MVTTLCLLPGLDGTGDLFAPLLCALGPTVRTQVVRYPTHEELDYGAHEALARRALPTGAPYVLLGESFSGPIAIEIAASAPTDLAGLILVGTFVRNPRPALAPLRHVLPLLPMRALPLWLARLIAMNRDATQPIMDLHERVMSTVSPRALRARLLAVADVDAAAALARVRVPILYLRATHDRLVPRSAGELVRAVAPRTRVLDIVAPHMLLQCAADETATAIRNFLASVSDRAGAG